MIGPGRAAMDPHFPRVITCMFAQGGKTSIAFNVIGSVMDSRPVPIMFVGSTQDQILRVIEPKVDGMLRACPELWARTLQGKKYARNRKVIAGATLRLAWPTPSQMSSDSVCIVIVDEIDRINRDIKGEGGIIELADARHNTWDNGKTLGYSTPTEGNIEPAVDERTGLEHWQVSDPQDVMSPVWALWQAGTRFEWAWPCPECREYFIPRFRGLVFDSKATLSQIRRDARLVCPHCAAAIATVHKQRMNARGLYVAPGQRPERDDRRHHQAEVADHSDGSGKHVRVDFGSYAVPRGFSGEDGSFWVSGLASFASKKTFGELASNHVKAARSGVLEKVRAVTNLQHGECFTFQGDAPKTTAVQARKGPYASGELPAGVVALFLTVDVGKFLLDYVVRGWGRDKESWLIEQGEIEGDPTKARVWADLEELRNSEWHGMKIERTAIDAGYRPNEVYAYCHAHRNCLATRGGSHERLYKAAKIEVDHRGQVKKYSFVLWHVDHDKSKQWVHSRMGLDPEDAGQWHIPGDTDDEYCRQIVAEQRIPTAAGKHVWRKTGANHKLDCEALQYFLAEKEHRLIVTRAARAKRLAEHDQGDGDETPANRKATRPRRRSFATGWRP